MKRTALVLSLLAGALLLASNAAAFSSAGSKPYFRTKLSSADPSILRALFANGKQVVVEGATEQDLERLLNIKVGFFLAQPGSTDKQSAVPLKVAAIGALKRPDGGYAFVHYVNTISDSMIEKNQSTALAVPVMSSASPTRTQLSTSTVTPSAITNQPCYTCLHDVVAYEYVPYGQLNSEWILAVDTSNPSKHWWDVRIKDSVSPGYTLAPKDSRFDAHWAVTDLKPNINVTNVSGEQLASAGPSSVSSDGTFSVNLGYGPTANASWSWTYPSIGVTESCNFTNNDCDWDFGYRYLSNVSETTNVQQPGAAISNTFGSFRFFHRHVIVWWNENNGTTPTSSDGYSPVVNDF